MIDGVGDEKKMLPELAGNIFVGRILTRQFQGDGQQVQAVHRHPARAVGLLDILPARQRSAAVEQPDVIQAQKAALKDVVALGVLAVHPPGEIQQHLMEDALQEGPIRLAPALLFDLVDTPGGPGMNRRVDVAEGPFVGGKLAVRVQIPLAHHEGELLLGVFGIHQG